MHNRGAGTRAAVAHCQSMDETDLTLDLSRAPDLAERLDAWIAAQDPPRPSRAVPYPG